MENNDKLLFRNHPFIIIKGFFAPIILLLTIFANNLDNIIDTIRAIKSDGITIGNENIYMFIAIGGFILICILIGLYEFFIWRNTFITIDNKEILWQKRGLFIKKKKQASLTNISNINSKASLLERIFGVNEISLDLNSSETAKEKDFKIILGNSESLRFKQILNERIRIYTKNEEQVSKSEDMDSLTFNNEVMVESTFERHFTKGESIRHILLNEKLIYIIVILAIGSMSSGIWMEKKVIIGIMIPVAVAIIGMLGAMLTVFNTVMGFKVARRDENLYIANGFTSKNSYSIPVRNITGIRVEKSLLARIFKYEMLKVEAIGIKSEKQSSDYVSLLMKKSEIAEYMKGLLPEFEMPSRLMRMPGKVFGYILIRNVIFLSILGLATGLCTNKLWIAVLALPIALLSAIIVYFYTKISMEDNRIVVSKGVLGISIYTLQLKKVENIRISTNVILKKMGLIKLHLAKRGSQGKSEQATGIFMESMFQPVISYYQAGEKYTE